MFPFQKSKRATENFDPEFTKEDAVLTPIDPAITQSINQEEFAGFSFVNEDFITNSKRDSVISNVSMNSLNSTFTSPNNSSSNNNSANAMDLVSTWLLPPILLYRGWLEQGGRILEQKNMPAQKRSPLWFYSRQTAID